MEGLASRRGLRKLQAHPKKSSPMAGCLARYIAPNFKQVLVFTGGAAAAGRTRRAQVRLIKWPELWKG